jgi:peptidoglycan/LPS O-acetylase OafA/YrhL
MPASVNRKYLPEIDQLRAYAALLVMFYHGLQLFGARLAHGVDFDPAQYWLHSENPVIAIIEEGHSGVGLFIVLSGFILSLGAIGKRVLYRGFLIARILRLYPMLIVCLIAATLYSHAGLRGFLRTLPPVNLPGRIDNQFTSMFWAVYVEFQCYLVFPLLIAVSDRRGTRLIVLVIGAALAVRLLAVLFLGASPRDLSYWTVFGRIDEFSTGIIAARLYTGRDWASLRAIWFAPAAAVAFVMLWGFNAIGGWPLDTLWKIAWPDVEGVVWAAFIVTYIAAGRRLPAAIAWAPTKIGEISYSMYLLHFAIVVTIVHYSVFVRFSGEPYTDALLTTLFIAAPAAVALAAVTYRAIELPFLRRRPRYIVAVPLTGSAGRAGRSAGAHS